jgi:hypothetical protein
MLPDDHDSALFGNPGVEDDTVPDRESLDIVTQPDDDACAVGAEDPGLRHRGKSPTDPEVEMVERGSSHPDEDLPTARLRVRNVLDDEDLGSSVLVDPNGPHWGRILA